MYVLFIYLIASFVLIKLIVHFGNSKLFFDNNDTKGKYFDIIFIIDCNTLFKTNCLVELGMNIIFKKRFRVIIDLLL